MSKTKYKSLRSLDTNTHPLWDGYNCSHYWLCELLTLSLCKPMVFHFIWSLLLHIGRSNRCICQQFSKRHIFLHLDSQTLPLISTINPTTEYNKMRKNERVHLAYPSSEQMWEKCTRHDGLGGVKCSQWARLVAPRLHDSTRSVSVSVSIHVCPESEYLQGLIRSRFNSSDQRY